MLRTATPTTPSNTQSMPVPHDKIAARAYEKWCRRGQPHGTAMQDWLDAERELQLESGRVSVQGQRR